MLLGTNVHSRAADSDMSAAGPESVLAYAAGVHGLEVTALADSGN